MRTSDFLQSLPWQMSDHLAYKRETSRVLKGYSCFTVYDEGERSQCLQINVNFDDSQRFVFIAISQFCHLISVYLVQLNIDFT